MLLVCRQYDGVKRGCLKGKQGASCDAGVEREKRLYSTENIYTYTYIFTYLRMYINKLRRISVWPEYYFVN